MHRLHALTQLLHPSAAHAAALAALVASAAIVAWLASRIDLTTIFAVGCAAEVFSGNWKYIPVPLPLDRLVLLFGAVLLVWRGAAASSDRRLRIKPIHLLLLAIILGTVASSLWAGDLASTKALYALLDRLGAIPFLMFTLAPLLFGDRKQRDVLLAVMVGLGLYLGVVGCLEGVHLDKLVLPRYITNPSLGITQSRTRGPFLASDAMGLGTFDCAVMAAVALTSWTGRWARRAAWAVVLMAGPVVLFTLTRSVWVGAVLGAGAAALAVPRWRRRLPALAVVGAVLVAGVVFTVPGLKAKVTDRATTTASVWDRYNTNDAALRMVRDHPLTGVGWQEFESYSPGYLRTPGTYPLTGQNLEVHNVFLSHFAELGLPGGLLWILALVTGVGGAIARRGPPELRAWRIGLLAIAVMFVTVANLGPLSYPFPNLMLWLVAGTVAVGWTSTARRPEAAGSAPLLEPEVLAAAGPPVRLQVAAGR